MKEKKKKEKKNTLPILCMVGPTSLWLLFFLLIPLIYVVVISFMTKGAYGGVVGKFSIDSYKKIFDPLYLTVMWKSVVMAFETSVICLIISIHLLICCARCRTRYAECSHFSSCCHSG